ncbi:MAG: site-2 protease family protein [Bacteroidetes bacterium]|nr:site-2 protease family protein [Bacteroidota bacterium]
MPEFSSDIYENQPSTEVEKTDKKNYLLHIGLFIITFITTTISGAQWISNQPGPYEYHFLLKGLPYSISIMFIISCHEFGHYFAAVYHKVKATLPFYIPFPPLPEFINFGTMGAVIKTKSPIYTKKAMFDIGVAGPIAGFVACLIVLTYGFTHVPGINYLLAIHPDFFSPDYGKNAIDLSFGNTILFSFFKLIFVHPGQFFPPMSEVYHYPYLCVGWFGLFVTAMNMIPVGQLDGGHISYTMFGEKNHYKIAVISFAILMVLGLLGLIETSFNLKTNFGWVGWLLWALLLFFVIKLKHPVVPDESELDNKRKFVGYLSFIILVISFSPTPFMVSIG